MTAYGEQTLQAPHDFGDLVEARLERQAPFVDSDIQFSGQALLFGLPDRQKHDHGQQQTQYQAEAKRA